MIKLTDEDVEFIQTECPAVWANIERIIKERQEEDPLKAWAESIGCKCIDREKYRWENCPVHEN